MRAMGVLLLLSASVQCGCQERKPPAMKDEDKIQGDWRLVSGERNGEEFANDAMRNVKLSFAGNVLKTQKMDDMTEATFTLHPEMSPKGIDLDMDGSLGLGIYKLDGDTLTILHGEVEEPRPKDFDDVKGGTLTLLVLRKAS